MSAVAIAELQYGVTAAAAALAQMYRRRRVQAILDRFEVLSFDVVAAEYYGVLASLGCQRGRHHAPPRGLAGRGNRSRHGLSLLTRKGSDVSGDESALAVVVLPYWVVSRNPAAAFAARHPDRPRCGRSVQPAALSHPDSHGLAGSGADEPLA